MENYTPISEFKVGQQYDQIFLIRNVQSITNKDKNFVKLEVEDVTGTFEGVVWDLKLKPTGSSMTVGSFVRMKIEIREYKGKTSFSTQKGDVFPYNGEPSNITDYVPGQSEAVLDVYSKELCSKLDDIEDPHIRDCMGSGRSRVDIIDMIRNAPFGLEGPLANRGGLLTYINDVLKVATSIVESTGRIIEPDNLNRSAIIAGCVLRHIGWATCTDFFGRVLKPNDSFYLIGVEKSSFRFVNHLIMHAESDLSVSFPTSIKLLLENMTDPSPNSLEGNIVSMASYVTQNIHSAQSILSKRSNSENWTYGGEFFKGHLNT